MKATLTLPNGTVVNIDGTPEEVQRLLEHYSAAPSAAKPKQSGAKVASPKKKAHSAKEAGDDVDHSTIANLAKTCEEAEQIEERILNRASVVDRTLLPLYIAHEHVENSPGLTSGDISKITTELGIPIATPNASVALAGSARRYVMGNRIRKKGRAVRYKLTHRGVKYMKAVIAGKSDGQ